MAELAQQKTFRLVTILGILMLGLFMIVSEYNGSNATASVDRLTLNSKTEQSQGVRPQFPESIDRRTQGVIEIRPENASNVVSHVEHKVYQNDFDDVLMNYSLLRRSYLGNEGYRFSASQQLNEKYLPPNVHYIWCGWQRFEFREYLSVMSVLRQIRPDKVTIHYLHEPHMDSKGYNQWLLDLKYEYPFFALEIMNKDLQKICYGNITQKISILLELLNEEGGIFVSDNTWFLEFDPRRRRVDFEYALDENSLNGYMILRKGVYKPGMTIDGMLKHHKLISRPESCAELRHFYNGIEKAFCVIIKGDRYESDFYPKDIWNLNNKFGRTARLIFYGTSEILVPVPSFKEIVPNIGHMVWVGGKEMDFLFYLSALSVLHVINVDVLYIHGDQEPKGIYWPQLKKNKRVKYILRSTPTWLYQDEIPRYFFSLMSDVIRVDIMTKYGGIYTDTDAIWVKPLSREEMGYEAVASYDWVGWSYPFPDSVNFGVSYGKKNAPFWQLFRESMRALKNDQPGYTGVQMPYKLLEKYPNLLRIDNHLSVICYKQRCHPTWIKDYHNELNDHVTSGSIPNWREDVHAFHWTYPNPPAFKDMDTLVNSTGMFAEIGQFVLKKAGLLPN